MSSDSKHKATIVGVGGVGSWIAEFLARAGLEIELIDGDRVEEKNIKYSNYSKTDIERRKVHALGAKIQKIGGDIKIEDVKAVDANISEVLENGSDVVVLCVDSIAARVSLLDSLGKSRTRLWMDCRAEGRSFQIFTQKSRMLGEFLSVRNPTLRRGCQPNQGEIEAGNLMCASRATQIVLDMIRGKEYPPEVIENEYIPS